MPNSVARLVFRAVVVVLGKVRAADLLQMVVLGEIGSDQEDGCEGEPGKQNEFGSSQTPSLDWTRLECANCESNRQGRFAALPRHFVYLFYYFQKGVSRDVEPQKGPDPPLVI